MNKETRAIVASNLTVAYINLFPILSTNEKLSPIKDEILHIIDNAKEHKIYDNEHLSCNIIHYFRFYNLSMI